jgi:hypothetical protein
MPHYQFLVDTYMRFEQRQAKLEFSYLKYAGFFAIASLFIVMQNEGIIVDHLPEVIYAGVGILFAMAMRMLFFSFDLDRKIAYHVNEGKELEEKYCSIIDFCYFAAIDSVKNKRFQGAVASRLIPFAFVGFFTIWAGVVEAAKNGIGTALIVGISSVALLVFTIFYLLNSIKQSQLFFSIG